MKKIVYGLLISLALVVLIFTMVLADPDCGGDCPPQPTPTDKVEEPTPTSPDGDIPTPTPRFDTETPIPPTATDTPAPDPTATGTDQPGRNPRATPTPNMVMPQTGGGLPPNVQIGLILICGIVLLFVAGMARLGRMER